jgi:molybdopterin converting factor small subunit
MHRIDDDYPGIENFTFKVAVNRILVDGEPLLKDGDELALMPPFAGG